MQLQLLHRTSYFLSTVAAAPEVSADGVAAGVAITGTAAVVATVADILLRAAEVVEREQLLLTADPGRWRCWAQAAAVAALPGQRERSHQREPRQSVVVVVAPAVAAEPALLVAELAAAVTAAAAFAAKPVPQVDL